MHYPFWHVPGMTSPMWIAVVAVMHVYVAMYAVGGSILLTWQTRLAYKTNDKNYLEYLRKHAWFFVLVTVVSGALLGVGIWWTIGLASPLATEYLIHIFLFGWAMEYVTFLLEIVSAFAFFYYWGKMTPKTHLKMGWIYAASAFMSLVIITPITAFQLNTGGWHVPDGFWRAMFNPQALPQILARTGGSILLGALYFFLHLTFKVRSSTLRDRVSREVGKWMMMGAALTIGGGIAWMYNLPASGSAALAGAAALNILMVIIFTVTAGVVGMLYFGPIKNPSWITPGFAILFFGMGLAATGAGEFIREATRKPYVIYGKVLGNGIRPQEIPSLKRDGYLQGGKWTRAYIGDKYPQVISGDKIDGQKLLSLPKSDRIKVGRTIFMYHCNDCHDIDGYSSVAQMTRGWSRPMLHDLVIHINRFHYFMPQWSGTNAEADLLTDYLYSARRPYPKGLDNQTEEGK